MTIVKPRWAYLWLSNGTSSSETGACFCPTTKGLRMGWQFYVRFTASLAWFWKCACEMPMPDEEDVTTIIFLVWWAGQRKCRRSVAYSEHPLNSRFFLSFDCLIIALIRFHSFRLRSSTRLRSMSCCLTRAYETMSLLECNLRSTCRSLCSLCSSVRGGERMKTLDNEGLVMCQQHRTSEACHGKITHLCEIDSILS